MLNVQQTEQLAVTLMATILLVVLEGRQKTFAFYPQIAWS